MLAIPALTALVAYAALDGLRHGRPGRRRRADRAALHGRRLPRPGGVQGADHRALPARLRAAARRRRSDWRDAIPLGVLAAGTVYVYSFPGLAWLGGMALVWGALVLVRGPAPARRWSAPALLAAPSCSLVLVAARARAAAATSPTSARSIPTAPTRAGSATCPAQISPLEALGIWPTSEFRLSAGASSLPAIVFYAGGAARRSSPLPSRCRAGSAATAPRSRPRSLAAAVLYLAARALGTVYTSAKALAIAAPLIALMTLGGLLAAEAHRRSPLASLAVAFALAAAASSFLILRQAPVGPRTTCEELAEIRPAGRGREAALPRPRQLRPLRAARLEAVHLTCATSTTRTSSSRTPSSQTSARSSTSTRSRPRRWRAFATCSRPGRAYASGPPPGYEPVAEHRDLRALASAAARAARAASRARPTPSPAASAAVTARAARGLGSFARPPVVAAGGVGAPTIEGGDDGAVIELDLPAGEWELSIQYDSTRAVDDRRPRARGDSSRQPRLPRPGAVLGGRARSGSTAMAPATITATVEDPPLAGRLLGADSVAHLGPVAATARRAAHRQLRRLRRLVQER